MLRSKPSLIRMLSLGVILIGVGCICLALFNILTPTVHLADAYKTSIAFESTIESTIEIKDKSVKQMMINSGDDIGSLSIPVLNKKLAIIQGTGTDELKKGVGHYIQSVMPGENDNCVLSGHRDTVFKNIGKLKIGDQLIVETISGKFVYEVKSMRIVKSDDKTVIVSTKRAVLTLTTCYPFNFIGSAPKRYIVSADLVKLTDSAITISE